MLDPQKIPNKLYFTIGEVSELHSIEPHVLRYWESEFSELKPVRRRGKRRYYTRREVDLISIIKELLYVQGYTINGARKQLKGHTQNSGAANSSNQNLDNQQFAVEINIAVKQLNKALDILEASD